MNYYAMNHAVLDSLAGSSITPKELRAKVHEMFPGEKYDNSYASACHDTGGKAEAWCPVCIANGGFAVSRNNLVVLGSEGFGTAVAHEYKRGSRIAPAVPRVTVPMHVESLEEEEARVNAAIEALELRREAAARDALLARVSALSADQLATILASAENTEDEQSESAVA
jgi:hypothetical protein